MKALTILQPWATLVVMGLIRFETRSWATKLRGPMLIHASKGRSGIALEGHPLLKDYIQDFSKLDYGAIIGQVSIVNVYEAVEFEESERGNRILTKLEKAMGAYSKGKWAWELRDAVPFQEVIPAKGTPGLWEFEDPIY